MLVSDLIEGKSRWIKKAWIRCFEKRNLDHAAAVHFTSNVEAEQAAKLGIVPKLTCVVPNGFDLEEVLRSADVSEGDQEDSTDHEPFLLFIGRVNWEKGLDRLITALPRVASCRLIIAGNDDNRYRCKLEALAMQYGVGDRISFIGPVYGARKSALMRRAAALILPSYSENFGNVVIEAMAMACPVIVTPEVGSAEIVLQTGGGMVLQGNPETLAAGINAMLADPGKLREMGTRARGAIATRFTWTAIAAEMDKVYGIIVSGRLADARVLSASAEASSK
jgi:glycosyltransferase involved in cell wall biosynthesis